MFLIVIILAFVLASILPNKNAAALHHIEVPLTDILAAVGPTIVTAAVNVVILEFAFINGAVCPAEDSLALLFTI
jgi:hypothetical protein